MLADALATTQSTLANARQLRSSNIQNIFNVSLYVLLLDQDLTDFTDALIHSNGKRKRAFFAKQQAVLIYEAAEDLTQLLGRDFRDSVKRLGASQGQLTALNEASGALHAFWKEQQSFLGGIRNALAAHREHDALLYAETLAAIEPLEVMRCAAQLSSRLEQLVRVLVDLASLTVGMDAILRDMLRSSARNNAEQPER